MLPASFSVDQVERSVNAQIEQMMETQKAGKEAVPAAN